MRRVVLGWKTFGLERTLGTRLDVIVVYKVDRLTRSLADFAKLVELFDKHPRSPMRVSLVCSQLIRCRGFITPTVASVSFVGNTNGLHD